MNRSKPTGLPLLLVLLAGGGCASARGDFAGDPAHDGGALGPIGPAPGDDASADGGIPGFIAGHDAAAPATGKTLLYAHTDTTLFSVDPNDPTLTPVKIGDFDCVGGSGGEKAMTDLAVDRDGKLYGVAAKTVYLDMQIGGGSVACGTAVALATSASFYGASFAPAGTLDPARETLVVANSAGDLYSVDVANGGALARVGTFGPVPADDGNGHKYKAPGKTFELSGDIVFLANGGKPLGFATVRDCPSPPSTTGCNKTDTLIEIDVSLLSASNPTIVTKAVRGQVVKGASCGDATHTSYGSMFGIAAFGGSIIGFARDTSSSKGSGTQSLVVRLDNADGTACLVSDATATAPGGWAGAGVTTTAPVQAPPPK